MAKIEFENESVEVAAGYRVDQITAALRFKAEHIKAKADPEIFTWAAYLIDMLFEGFCQYRDAIEKLETENRQYEETIKRLEAEAAERYD